LRDAGGASRGGGALGGQHIQLLVLVLVIRRLLACALAILLGLFHGDEEVRVALAARVVLVEDDAEVGVLVDGQFLLLLHIVHLRCKEGFRKDPRFLRPRGMNGLKILSSTRLLVQTNLPTRLQPSFHLQHKRVRVRLQILLTNTALVVGGTTVGRLSKWRVGERRETDCATAAEDCRELVHRQASLLGHQRLKPFVGEHRVHSDEPGLTFLR
jgi:hypothetical protein